MKLTASDIALQVSMLVIASVVANVIVKKIEQIMVTENV